jgi:hypothetical protein
MSKPLLTAYTPRRHRLPPLLNAARLPRACAPAALPRASDLSAIKSFYAAPLLPQALSFLETRSSNRGYWCPLEHAVPALRTLCRGKSVTQDTVLQASSPTVTVTGTPDSTSKVFPVIRRKIDKETLLVYIYL